MKRKRILVYLMAMAVSNSILWGCGSFKTKGTTDAPIQEITPSVCILNSEEQKEVIGEAVKIKGVMYYSTREKSDIGARCGVMDGEIESTVKQGKLPKKDNQSNFGSGYGYQFVSDDSVDVFINNQWIRFNKEKGEESSQFLKNASPETSGLSLSIFDGKQVKTSWIYDVKAEEKLLDEINSYRIAGLADVDYKSLTGPMYGFEVGRKDGTQAKAVWWDGYWIDDELQTYKVNMNLKDIIETYDWKDEDVTSLTSFPLIHYFAYDMGTWNKNLLVKSPELKDKGISLKLVTLGNDSITVKLTNTTEEELTYGKYFGLQTQIDSEWYDVPAEKELCVNDIALLLPAGGTSNQIYDITPFGKLPEGKYRLVTEEAAVEFPVK